MRALHASFRTGASFLACTAFVACTALVDFDGIQPYPDGGNGGRPNETSFDGGPSGGGAPTEATGGSVSSGASPSNSGGAPSVGSGGAATSNGGATGAGATAFGGTPSSGGAPSSGGTPSSGGAPSSGGTPSSGGGGQAGSTGCSNPSKWYLDSDGDHYGDDTMTTAACAAPGHDWVQIGGDCQDHDSAVHPATSSAPMPFQGTGYTDNAGQESFDYDCNGAEEGDPSQDEVAACSGLTSCDQGAAGYLPRTDRSGPGVDSFCGSTTTVTCTELLNLLLCSEASRATSQPPRRCR